MVQVQTEALDKVHRLLLPGGQAVLTQPNPSPYSLTVDSGGELLFSEMVLEPNFIHVVETALRSYQQAAERGLFRVKTFPGVGREDGVFKSFEYPSIDTWLEDGSAFSIDKPVLEDVAARAAGIIKDLSHTVTMRFHEDLIILEKQ